MRRATLLACLLLAASALTAQAMPPAQPAVLKGQVLEVLDVESYTYLRLKTPEGETWAAVPTTSVKKGAEVTIGNTMLMQNFESKTLKRKFDKIVFGMIEDPSARRAPAMGAPHGSAPVASVPIAKITRATGPDAKTVSELVTGRDSLKGKTVLLRGQVVKVNNGIMGKNWVHLQDGSGSAASGTNDILVTTQDKATVGDVVNARGTVRTDVNLGSGYAYAVLVEDATLARQ